MSSIPNFGFELYIFIAVEALIIMVYILFYKYSQRHGGVFDRRIRERRTYGMHNSDRRLTDIGFREALAAHLNAGGIASDRRVRQRRYLSDRRNI